MKTKIFVIALFFLLCACEKDKVSQLCVQNSPCSIIDGKVEMYTNTNPPQSLIFCNLGTTSCKYDKNNNPEIECVGYKSAIDNDNDGFFCDDCDDTNPNINPNQIEICNGKNDNCDEKNLIDEDLEIECWTGDEKNIFNDKSSCKKGKSSCINGKWSSCFGQVLPSTEICEQEGIDENCDGNINETKYNSCGYSDTGACHLGDEFCTGNDFVCINAVYPQAEECNNIDDNCNSIIDERLFRPCETLCGNGFETCEQGKWVKCSAQQPVDNNCLCENGDIQPCINGIIDTNGNPVFCGIGAKICNEEAWGQCIFFNTSSEQCNNWDDDCDGTIDLFSRACGAPETAGIGVCEMGIETCNSGLWNECEGAVNPSKEICNQLDDDCDSLVDEKLNKHNKVDIVFAIDISGSMCSSIFTLREGIANYVNDFVGTEHRFGLIAFPPNLYAPWTPDGSDYYIKMTTPTLTDVVSFLNVLSSLVCDGGYEEPSYDILYLLSHHDDPIQIGWRADAYPYVILITDEEGQTWGQTTENEVSLKTFNCQIGGCVAGDKIEVYVMTLFQFFIDWDEIVFFEQDRLIDLMPPTEERYTEALRNIFTNVCF